MLAVLATDAMDSAKACSTSLCMDDLHSEGRDVKMMGGALAHCSVLVSAGGCATADGIGHSVGQLTGASVYTQIAAVDAEMAWCSSTGDW